MSLTLPMPHTSDLIASNPVTSKDGNYQYAALYTCGDAGARVYVFRKHKFQTWSQADISIISGAALTALDLPVDDDGHNFISIALSYDATGRIVRRVYLWANMHNGVGPTGGNLKMIRTTTTDGTIGSWEVTTLPGTINECTYPVAIQLANGGIWYTMRDGGISGDGDYVQWMLPPGSDTWTRSVFMAGQGSATGGESPYVYFHVRPNGHILCMGSWRTATFDDFANAGAFFMYSSDNAVTWKTITNVALPKPITYAMTQAADKCELGLTLTGGEAAFLNGGGVCWGPNGPEIWISLNPAYHVAWNSTTQAWVQTQIGSTGGIDFDGYRVSTRCVPIYFRGKLAYLGVGYLNPYRWRRFPLMFIMSNPTTCIQVINLGTQVSFGEINNDAGQHWDFCNDREAYIQGKVSVWTPSGNTPFTADFSNYGIQRTG